MSAVWLFGSIALVADGLHMSTHAGALLLAALAYTYARRRAGDPNFTFGTGKFGDLAGFTSAIILAMIALLIAYESGQPSLCTRYDPFYRSDPDCLPWLGCKRRECMAPSGGGHHHGHSHGHAHGGHNHDEAHHISTGVGSIVLEVFEDGVPPRFRLRVETGPTLAAQTTSIETVRPDGTRQLFAMKDQDGYLELVEEIPEPHAFTAHVRTGQQDYPVVFEEHEHAHDSADRDNNMRAAIIHVMADAAVSVLVITGLVLARTFGWLWMDPLAGIIGATVIASWSYGLIRDTGAILLDMNPDQRMANNLRQAVESGGDQLADLHLWRLGPGHLGAIISVITAQARDTDYYRARLARFKSLSHLTVEVLHKS